MKSRLCYLACHILLGCGGSDPISFGTTTTNSAGGDEGGSTSSGGDTNSGGANEGGTMQSGGAGGDSGGGTQQTGGIGGTTEQCLTPNHWCDGSCEQNTPETGCYQSTVCTACPEPTHGVAICSLDGFCAVQCNAPYIANGQACVCPNQCCVDADCGGNASCQNGTCVSSTCDEQQCDALCLIQGMIGVCVGSTCTCV